MDAGEPVAAALFKSMLEQAADALIFADRDGLIRVWNQAAATLFGYGAEEALGESLDLIIPERFRRAHWEGYRAAIATGCLRDSGQVLTTRSMHRNGSKLYVDLSFSLVRESGGAVAGALAIGRDCTARRLEENALRARLAELEGRPPG